ncbi:TraR/DksA C4-type zinc finger protein [Paenibacillus sp. IB182496]|uniref:TraR/DksA C4-type zinc finger protein n=1 Tax=Paenibacillus sabuli TaxID=2772509 RepID=A0A927GT24_9BACL|nr:TraR/DksA C4-type zinc finger protein [Paenibacillus sabuli]MBD2846272.1 TraR/DksA C4-type zinc finger protein [Paenibacillus sabuli]
MGETNAERKLKQRLTKEKERLERELSQNRSYNLASAMRESTGELSTNDNHPADNATDLYERGKDIALLEQEELHLVRIQEALEALEAGTYGICRACGRRIDPERLEAVPDSLYCVEHAPRHTVSERRPAEESPAPFGRSDPDAGRGPGGFDGEDAWQTVESWGNSDSPAMREFPVEDFYDELGGNPDDNEGFVEPLESFVATDMTGTSRFVYRNRQYRDYIDRGEYEVEIDMSGE